MAKRWFTAHFALKDSGQWEASVVEDTIAGPVGTDEGWSNFTLDEIVDYLHDALARRAAPRAERRFAMTDEAKLVGEYERGFRDAAEMIEKYANFIRHSAASQAVSDADRREFGYALLKTAADACLLRARSAPSPL